MVQRIHILPQDVVLKIAAGEVVERPASVVKELLENSIDAGAKRIEVRVQGSGIENIEVVDDGIGISSEDAPQIFKRHSTSKISTDSDLYKILTYGFRGEALASIAQVSRVNLVSRAEGSETGFSISVEGGEIQKIEEIAVPTGTRVTVSDLFFNVPVRKKFLRSRQTELALISSVFERFAIAHPDRHLKFTIGSRLVFDLQSVKELHERLKIIFGESTASILVPFHYQVDDVMITGFASPPEITDIRGSYLYVNKRFVRDRLITKAIQRGYSIGKERTEPFFTILFLEIPPEEVDVNVHPQKYEVRFKNSSKIFSMVSNAIAGAFRRVVPGVSVQKIHPEEMVLEKSVSDRYERIQESLETYLIREGFLKYSDARQNILEIAQSGREVEYSNEVELLLRDVLPRAQIFNRYILCEALDGILLIDQHAAHEMLTFYNLKRIFSEKLKDSQYLLTPEVIEVSPGDLQILLEAKDILMSIGFDIEQMGENSIIVRSVPSCIAQENLRSIINGIIDQIKETGGIHTEALDNLLSSIACHTSIRTGEKLNIEEMMSIINELRIAYLSPYCPHGRPVMYFLPVGEIEKWFRRK